MTTLFVVVTSLGAGVIDISDAPPLFELLLDLFAPGLSILASPVACGLRPPTRSRVDT